MVSLAGGDAGDCDAEGGVRPGTGIHWLRGRRYNAGARRGNPENRSPAMNVGGTLKHRDVIAPIRRSPVLCIVPALLALFPAAILAEDVAEIATPPAQRIAVPIVYEWVFGRGA